MKLIFFLSSLIIVQAGVIKEERNGVTINGVYLDKEVLLTDVDRPYLLALDKETNTLYFNFGLKNDTENYESGQLDLDTKEITTVHGVKNGYAHAVDENTHNVYISGDDGIYKYSPDTNTTEIYYATDMDIWTLFFKNNVLYFTTYVPEEPYLSQYLYSIVDGEIKKFSDLEDTTVHNFLLDDHDVMFFSNDTGLYSQERGATDRIVYKEFTSDAFAIRSLTTDAIGNVYACFVDGIYAVNKENVNIEKVVDVDYAFGVAFDSDNNIIYSDSDSLVKLSPHEQ